VAVVGGILGAIVGLVIGLLFTEEIFANNQSWPDVVPFALAVAGAMAGSQGARRFANRNVKPS
jgi:ABC-type phosphate/phosphonate transport system permease subunit